jgi:hypothetical protein
MRAIILAVVTLAALGVAPVRGQDVAVLHAIGIYNAHAPYMLAYQDEPVWGSGVTEPLWGSGATFFARCLLAIGDTVCISLWTLDEESFWPRQGLTVLNRTDKDIRVRLDGCEIHNGAQTIMIDGAYKDDPRIERGTAGPIDDIIPAHGQMTPLLHDPEDPGRDSIAGMHNFYDGVRLTCRVATATPAP